ncbi:unnamed protein product, partial [Meganyctiphanes norvegica]
MSSTSSIFFVLEFLSSKLHLKTSIDFTRTDRWRQLDKGKWRGSLGKRIWTLTQEPSHISYQVHEPENDINDIQYLSDEKYEEILRDYFQLDICLQEKYQKWSQQDKNFASISSKFPGVRILNQDPVENVFAFICSSNNNIQRITLLVERLCSKFGKPLIALDGTTWYTFPAVESLAAQGVEEILRQLGFGYRAKFIHESAKTIVANGGEQWLHSLRNLPYDDCHKQLKTLTGVGAKVSDCICLMSMGHLGAIPVDTHVFQIAARDYLPELQKCKTVTDKIYRLIGDHFRIVFGEHAGWAHSVLFSADLKKFETLKESCNSDKKSTKQKKK